MRKTSKRAIALALSASMILGSSMTAMAATTDPNISEREINNKILAKNIAAQGMVLLENENNVLPISAKKGTRIALFGEGVYNTVIGGTGSGMVNQRDKVTVRQGFENAGYNIVNADFIAQVEKQWRADGGSDNPWRNWVNERVYTEMAGAAEKIEAAAKETDTAVYVIGRKSGEGGDRSFWAGDYLLSRDEKENLTLLGETFEHVIVVLNVGGAIDTKFFKEINGLDAMLLMSQAGMTGGDAVVEVLNGTVNPSGKLTDTWTLDYMDNPSSKTFAYNDGNMDQEVYNDDIFVGYRYYDTFGVDVAYEFGYGGSYTDFTIQTDSVTADQDKVTVKATVRNVGTVSGKEVVEVYFSAPEGKLDKPYQELAGYAKTDELAPGEEQTLTITYDTTEMSSYDEEKAAYVMEDGDYLVRVGNSSRNTHVAGKISLEEDVITEQYSNLMVLPKDNENLAEDDKYPELDILTTEDAEPITYEGEAEEIAAADCIGLDFTGYVAPEIIKENEDVTVYTSATTETEYLFADNVDGATAEVSRVEKGNENTSDYTVKYNETVKKFDGNYRWNTLKDVYNGKITVEQFVSGLSLYELSTLVNGTLCGENVQGVAGATWNNPGKGLTTVNLADGPAGLRITQSYQKNGTTYYQFATAWPVGTLVAQTWDRDLIYAFGKGVGQEMEEFGIGCWLAPGMNIHRNALCGRNFEYFSEDPLVVGVTGTAVTLGVQSCKGVGVTIKHYAVNSQETNRYAENNIISERAIREIYLKGFEMVVKQAQPMAIMASYNQNNGRPASDDYDLCTGFARNEWGFQGLIMTDWGYGSSVPMYEMHAGNDLNCPGAGYAQIMKGFKTEPDWDGKGYVKMTTVSYQDENFDTITEEVPNWGGYELSLTGRERVSTSVYGDVNQNPEILNPEVFKLIDEGYAYTLVYYGRTYVYYKVNTKLDSLTNKQVISLGDLHKAAINICNFVMRSLEFANANGFEAKPLNEVFADDLQTISGASKDEVKGSIANGAISSLVAMIMGLDASEYTKESWAAVEAAVAAAKAVAADTDATQADFDAAVSGLVAAIGGLEYGVQKLHLEVAIEAAEKILALGKNYEDIEALTKVVEDGKAVLADENASQEAVDGAAYAVLDELFKMAKTADISSLESLIEAAKGLLDGKYTSDSLENLKDAIDAAEAVIADPDREDSAISDAYANLIDAIISLKMKGNKAALEAMLKKANEVLAEKDAYVAETIEGLAEVTAEAQAVYDNEDALQSEVNEAVKTLTLKVAEARLLGDVDADGEITTADSAAVLRSAAEIATLSAEAAASADVNGDGTADTSDAVLILQYAAEKIAAF